LNPASDAGQPPVGLFCRKPCIIFVAVVTVITARAIAGVTVITVMAVAAATVITEVAVALVTVIVVM
jgi:hypothetical protein